MEQKTEASQAVNEPVLPHLPRAVGYLHTMDNTDGLEGNRPWRVFNFIKRNPFGKAGLDYSASYPVTNESLFTASQMKEYARAALKAQPAPTEAQSRPDFSKFATIEEWQVAMSKWSLNAAIAKSPTEPAQGEDSARLVGGYIGAVITAQHGRAAKLALLYETEGQAIAASEFIGELVARASAETGGVKS